MGQCTLGNTDKNEYDVPKYDEMIVQSQLNEISINQMKTYFNAIYKYVSCFC